jgi:hypothetical protein
MVSGNVDGKEYIMSGDENGRSLSIPVVRGDDAYTGCRPKMLTGHSGIHNNKVLRNA